jgi:hypothetical protein
LYLKNVLKYEKEKTFDDVIELNDEKIVLVSWKDLIILNSDKTIYKIFNFNFQIESIIQTSDDILIFGLNTDLIIFNYFENFKIILKGIF